MQPYSAKIPAHHKTVQEVEVLFSSTARSYLSSALKDSYFLGLTSEAAREVENGQEFNLTASVNDELKLSFLTPHFLSDISNRIHIPYFHYDKIYGP